MLSRALRIVAAVVPFVVSFNAPALDLMGLGDPALACKDFDEYVNGAWKKSATIPPDRARIGSFDDLRDRSRQEVQRALADVQRNPDLLDTPGKRLATRFYLSGIDEAAVDKRGLASLQPVLARIDGLTDRAQLPALIAELARLGIAAPVVAFVAPDAKDRTRYVVHLDQGGLGLPDRDDYFRDDQRTVDLRKAYATYRQRLATLSGDKADAGAPDASFALQKPLAAASQKRVERRDPNVVYQLNTLTTLAQRAPGLDWAAFFAALGVPQPGEFVVGSPRFLAEVAQAAQRAPLEQWRAYLRERLLDEAARTLPRPYFDARFDYRERVIRGVERPMPRSEEVIDLITGNYGGEPLAEGLGQLYVARAFPPEAKARALEMIADIRAALAARIRQLDWMAEPTKQKALQKLAAMTPKIGYPDRWKTYEGLVIATDDYSGNWMRARQWAFDDRLAYLGRPVDRTRWFTSPQLVNAFAGGINEITFPAAILQPPFFDAQADPALNYGGIGSVIGHEITHHFDDRGRQFDLNGNLADWWTPQDAVAYKARAAKLAEQYSAYVPAPDHPIDGLLTLGENISDTGGVQIAFDGLQIALARHPVGPIDGFDQNQRFFLSFATVWRTQQRTPALINQLRTDPHSPARYRILGPLANFPAFGAAFKCPADAPMMRPAAQQISIW